MRYVSIFIESVGGRWFFLPATVTGLAGLVAILRARGVTWVPEISWWALAFFALAPLTVWSVIGLLKKVVSLEKEISQLNTRLDEKERRNRAAEMLQTVIEDFIALKNRLFLFDYVVVSEIEQAEATFEAEKLAIFQKLAGILSGPEIYSLSIIQPSSFAYAGNPKRSVMMIKLDSYIKHARDALIKYT